MPVENDAQFVQAVWQCSAMLHLAFTIFNLLLAAVLLPVVGGLCLDQAQVLSRGGSGVSSSATPLVSARIKPRPKPGQGRRWRRTRRQSRSGEHGGWRTFLVGFEFRGVTQKVGE